MHSHATPTSQQVLKLSVVHVLHLRLASLQSVISECFCLWIATLRRPSHNSPARDQRIDKIWINGWLGALLGPDATVIQTHPIAIFAENIEAIIAGNRWS